MKGGSYNSQISENTKGSFSKMSNNQGSELLWGRKFKCKINSVCMCVFVCVYMCACMYVCVCLHVSLCVCLCVHRCVCLCVYTWVCVYICMCAFVYHMLLYHVLQYFSELVLFFPGAMLTIPAEMNKHLLTPNKSQKTTQVHLGGPMSLTVDIYRIKGEGSRRSIDNLQVASLHKKSLPMLSTHVLVEGVALGGPLSCLWPLICCPVNLPLLQNRMLRGPVLLGVLVATDTLT